MSKKSDKRKTLWFLGALLVLFVFVGLFSTYNQSFSILSASKAQIGEDGVPQWVILMSPTYSGEKIVFSANVQTLDPWDDGKGGAVVPQDDIEITFSPKDMTCTYQLTDTTTFGDKVSNWIRIWGDDYRFYGISPGFERTGLITITDNNGNSETIDGFDVGNSVDFTANNGNINIEAQGALVAKKDCPSLDRYAVRVNLQDQSIEFVNKLDSNGIRIPASEVSNGNFQSYNLNAGRTELIANMGKDGLGASVLTVVADANYLDYKYVPAELGQPKIVSIENAETIQEGTLDSIVLTVKNVADSTGKFKATSISDDFYLNPPTQNFELAPNEEIQLNFGLVAGEVDKNFKGDGSIRVCALSQFEQGQCVTESYEIVVEDKAVFTPSSCGDNVCGLNENYATCSLDCGKQLVCEGLHKQVINGQCVCEAGYELLEDKFGREYCGEAEGEDMTLIIAVVGAILTIMAIMGVVAYKRRK